MRTINLVVSSVKLVSLVLTITFLTTLKRKEIRTCRFSVEELH